VAEEVVTIETVHCVECGDELPAERAGLGYTYCTKDTCQKKHYRGLRVTVAGTHKGADAIVALDADEVRRRGEAGELARDTGLGLDYRSGVGHDTPHRPRPAPASQRPARPRRPWTPQQEKLVRLYHDMGLSPGRIAERARQTAPRLGITERLAVQILSAPPRR
jgi:hypothetical protein